MSKLLQLNKEADVPESAGKKLRELLARPEGLFAFGIYDAMSTRVSELAGVEAIYVGGYAAAARDMWPDMGIMTASEVLDHVRRIDRIATVPLMVDIDDGYGGILNVIRTTREMLSLASVAAIHIEDQRYPKRCGHIAGKEVIPASDFVGKLRAVLDERDRIDPKKLVVARTDAFSAAGGRKDPEIGGDIDEAIRRGIAYTKAGADLIWCEFPTPDIESAKAFAMGVRGECPDQRFAFNISPSFKAEHWKKSTLDRRLLNELGYKFQFATYPAILGAMNAVFNLAELFAREPVWAMQYLKASLEDSPTRSVMEVVGVDDYQSLEEKYDPKASARIQSSEGFKRES